MTEHDPTVISMIENMIAWAKGKLGDPDYAGWCLSFIEDALEVSNDIEIFGGDSAKESCVMYADALRTGVPEKGAFVFYYCLCPSEDGPVNWGHCGIALDDGSVVHAWDKVRIDDYLKMEALTALTGDHPDYIGWVPVERVLAEKDPDAQEGDSHRSTGKTDERTRNTGGTAMKLSGFLITVKDIEKAKQYYHDLFGLEMLADNDGNMLLSGGLVLQAESYWRGFLGRDVIPKSNSCELYFEESDIEGFIRKLETLYPETEYVNRLMTHSWGQRVVRFYDPDGNLIEVGTPMGP